MIKLVGRIMILLVISSSGYYIYADRNESSSSCWQTALSKWTSCDSAYSGTVNNYFALQGSAPRPICSSSADAACTSDPYPSQCWTNAYNACAVAINSAWNSRATSYGDCLGGDGNANFCVEDPEFNCGEAAGRNEACGEAYGGTDNLGAKLACRSASGVDSCL